MKQTKKEKPWREEIQDIVNRLTKLEEELDQIEIIVKQLEEQSSKK